MATICYVLPATQPPVTGSKHRFPGLSFFDLRWRVHFGRRRRAARHRQHRRRQLDGVRHRCVIRRGDAPVAAELPPSGLVRSVGQHGRQEPQLRPGAHPPRAAAAPLPEGRPDRPTVRLQRSRAGPPTGAAPVRERRLLLVHDVLRPARRTAAPWSPVPSPVTGGETANTWPDPRTGAVRRRPAAPVRGRPGAPSPRRLAGPCRRCRDRAYVRAPAAGRVGPRTGLPGGGDPVRPPRPARPVRRDVRRHPGQ